MDFFLQRHAGIFCTRVKVDSYQLVDTFFAVPRHCNDNEDGMYHRYILGGDVSVLCRIRNKNGGDYVTNQDASLQPDQSRHASDKMDGNEGGRPPPKFGSIHQKKISYCSAIDILLLYN